MPPFQPLDPLPIYAFSASAIPTALTAAAALALGGTVAVRERASRESLSLLGLCLGVTVWLGCFTLMYLARTPAAAMFWAKAAYLGIPLIPPAIYSFAVHVLRIHRRRRALLRAAWVASLAFVPWIVLGDDVIVGLYRYPWGYYPRYAAPAAIYLTVFLLVMLMTQVEFLMRLRSVGPGTYRSRILALTVAFAVAYFAVLDYLAAMGVALYPFGYVPVLIFLALCARTIRRYRLVDLTPSFAAPEILATMADPLVVSDTRGRIRVVNRALRDLLGYEESEMLGAGLDTLHLPGPDEPTLEHLLTATGRQAWETRLLTADGEAVDVALSCSRLLDAAGACVGLVLIGRDIRERKAAEAALRQSQEELLQSQKMDAVGRLAGGVAHDFNNLLTVINGHAGMILSEPGEDSETRSSVEEILDAGRRASDLTRQLLAFSRKQMLQPRVLDLNAVVAGIERLLGRMIGEDVELVVERSADPVYVSADPGQLEQVLVNLAVNARDAMPGGGRLRFATRAVTLAEERVRSLSPMPAGRYVELAVSDDGCGIEPEVLKRIFEPFFTTKEQGKGTGLGLSTVYGIVKQSGGYIEVRSEVGVGTTFHIYFPPERWAEPLGPEVSPAEPELRGAGTILLVEDDPSVRSIARQILARCGYDVLQAGSGGEAIRLAADHPGPLHLLLSDVVMPGMGGRDLAEQVGRLRPGLPVLFMSGYTDDAIAPHGVLRDPRFFLEKPFAPSALAAKVRSVLGG